MPRYDIPNGVPPSRNINPLIVRLRKIRLGKAKAVSEKMRPKIMIKNSPGCDYNLHGYVSVEAG
jgi:hypothetical protein